MKRLGWVAGIVGGGGLLVASACTNNAPESISPAATPLAAQAVQAGSTLVDCGPGQRVLLQQANGVTQVQCVPGATMMGAPLSVGNGSTSCSRSRSRRASTRRPMALRCRRGPSPTSPSPTRARPRAPWRPAAARGRRARPSSAVRPQPALVWARCWAAAAAPRRARSSVSSAASSTTSPRGIADREERPGRRPGRSLRASAGSYALSARAWRGRQARPASIPSVSRSAVWGRCKGDGQCSSPTPWMSLGQETPIPSAREGRRSATCSAEPLARPEALQGAGEGVQAVARPAAGLHAARRSGAPSHALRPVRAPWTSRGDRSPPLTVVRAVVGMSSECAARSRDRRSAFPRGHGSWQRRDANTV